MFKWFNTLSPIKQGITVLISAIIFGGLVTRTVESFINRSKVIEAQVVSLEHSFNMHKIEKDSLVNSNEAWKIRVDKALINLSDRTIRIEEVQDVNICIIIADKEHMDWRRCLTERDRRTILDRIQ